MRHVAIILWHFIQHARRQEHVSITVFQWCKLSRAVANIRSPNNRPTSNVYVYSMVIVWTFGHFPAFIYFIFCKPGWNFSNCLYLSLPASLYGSSSMNPKGGVCCIDEDRRVTVTLYFKSMCPSAIYSEISFSQNVRTGPHKGITRT